MKTIVLVSRLQAQHHGRAGLAEIGLAVLGVSQATRFLPLHPVNHLAIHQSLLSNSSYDEILVYG
jgi:hypothetical protein